MNKKILLAELHGVIGHTMGSSMPSLSYAMMSALRQADPSKGEVVMIDNGEVAIFNPQQAVDLDVDYERLMKKQDELHLQKIKQGKERLSEIVEQDRGVKFVNHDMRTIYEDPHPSGKAYRRNHKPNTGIEIGSYKKKPKKQKQRKF